MKAEHIFEKNRKRISGLDKRIVNLNVHLQEAIFRRLDELDIGLIDLAIMLNVSVDSLSHLINSRNVTLEDIAKIEIALGDIELITFNER